MKNIIYKITIINFDKYNGKKKKGYESIMLSCRFFDDAKIMRLTPLQRLIYIRLLLVAGDFISSSIEVHPEMIARSTGVPLQMIVRSLNALVENQLVTMENPPALIEEKRKEKTNKEKKKIVFEKKSDEISTVQERPSKLKDDDEKGLRKRIRDAYSECYKQRYGVDVVFNKEFNSKIKSLSLRLGEEAIEVVKFFLTHNDGFYLKSTHSIGLCLRDCESLRTQMLRGRAITSSDIKRVEKMQQTTDLQKAYEKGGF